MRNIYKVLKPENRHDRNFLEFKDTISEIERMMKEMEYVLTSSYDTGTAAKAIREHWDPKMDVALDKAKVALAKWMVGLHSLTFNSLSK
jgi:hypothetical protein